MPHTPGPWTFAAGYDADGDDVFEIRGSVAGLIADVNTALPQPNRNECGCGGDPGDNARLIAAAPDLLTELRDFHDHAIDQDWHTCDGIPGGCPALAAIAKAEGK